MSKESKKLIILQLYPRDMNIYGDWGNVLVLMRRAKWHGYTPKLIEYNPDDDFPSDIDIVVGGGGQDSGQDRVQADLLKISQKLTKMADEGVPMLVICGLYQLFGNCFITREGRKIQGIGVFNMDTQGSDERMIGNIATNSEKFGQILGYENHSGKTYLHGGTKPLARAEKSMGNNGEDKSEGAIYNNVIGSYLHGSLLPKNPAIADWLLEIAAERKYGEFTPTVIDDTFAKRARNVATKRPR